MASPCLTSWLAAGVLAAFLLPPLASPGAAQSLGEKVKEIFVSPTPTPARHRTKRKKSSSSSSATPSPSPSPKRKIKTKQKSPTPAPTPSETSTPSPTPTATPSPAKAGKKHKTPTPSPSPSETPTPTPTESPSPNGRVATISPNEIRSYEENPEPVRKLLDDALASHQPQSRLYLRLCGSGERWNGLFRLHLFCPAPERSRGRAPGRQRAICLGAQSREISAPSSAAIRIRLSSMNLNPAIFSSGAGPTISSEIRP